MKKQEDEDRMMIKISIDLDEMWTDNGSIGQEIRDHIKWTIEQQVKKEVGAAVKEILERQRADIKKVAGEYAKKVVAGLLT